MEMGLLYDSYGELLTEKQRRFFELYFLDDLSLGEIADQFAVSRQAVYDILRRSQNTLERMEAKLGLVAAERARAGRLASLMTDAERLVQALADPASGSPEARRAAEAVRRGLEGLRSLERADAGGGAAGGLRTSE
ncbi:DNA-binding protein [Limnochorda pilosa]|uniref:UPF0122 protein LIP_1627 n=1 Tax=Limnochorda pilosa TaxID=1555112 RepID=A0A0K2SK30_LIMPI|nr:DNA-binding protein [Limnochorda pilosa]